MSLLLKLGSLAMVAVLLAAPVAPLLGSCLSPANPHANMGCCRRTVAESDLQLRTSDERPCCQVSSAKPSPASPGQIAPSGVTGITPAKVIGAVAPLPVAGAHAETTELAPALVSVQAVLCTFLI
jgi:hypothetical protein